MGAQISFFVPCLPPKTTAQQKGAFAMPGGGIRFYEKSKVRSAREELCGHLRPHVPAIPLYGPLTCEIEFIWPWRKSEKKGNIKTFRRMPMDSKPDCSNIVKMIEDVMTSLRFWNDDSQVACLKVSKWWGEEPGIRISVGYAMPEIGGML